MLPLSENGIYTVNGLEKRRGEKTATRLVWKFEYSVEDKRMPQTGHLVSGEKVLHFKVTALAPSNTALAPSASLVRLFSRTAFAGTSHACYYQADISKATISNHHRAQDPSTSTPHPDTNPSICYKHIVFHL